MYYYKRAPGMGVRFDIFNDTRRICMAHTEADAKMIVEALQRATKGTK